MPGVVLRASHVFIYLILSTTLWNECLSLRHQFTDRELRLQGQCDRVPKLYGSKDLTQSSPVLPRVHSIRILAEKKNPQRHLLVSLGHQIPQNYNSVQFSLNYNLSTFKYNFLIDSNKLILLGSHDCLQSSRRQVDNMKLIIGAKQNLSLDPACKFLADNPGQILNPLHQSLLICKCLQSVLLLLKFF